MSRGLRTTLVLPLAAVAAALAWGALETLALYLARRRRERQP
jgi:hypothetical protein